MAQGELGRFDDAIATAQRAQQAAEAADLDELTDEIQQRIETYRAGLPWRDD